MFSLVFSVLLGDCTRKIEESSGSLLSERSVRERVLRFRITRTGSNNYKKESVVYTKKPIH